MTLFEIVDGRAQPTPHVLLIEPFKSMWDSDSSKGKKECIKKFSYIEFLCNPSKNNPYYGYEYKARKEKICIEIFGKEDYEPDENTIKATEKFVELLENSNPGYVLLSQSIDAKDSLISFLSNVNYDERTPHGAVVFKPSDIVKALRESIMLAEQINELRDKFEEEDSSNSRTRRNREIGEYER